MPQNIWGLTRLSVSWLLDLDPGKVINLVEHQFLNVENEKFICLEGWMRMKELTFIKICYKIKNHYKNTLPLLYMAQNYKYSIYILNM